MSSNVPYRQPPTPQSAASFTELMDPSRFRANLGLVDHLRLGSSVTSLHRSAQISVVYRLRSAIHGVGILERYSTRRLSGRHLWTTQVLQEPR